MLDAVVDYLPAPIDVPDIKGVLDDGTETIRKSTDHEPFSALAFKIMTDPFVGKLNFLPCILRYIEFRLLCFEFNERKT